MYGASLAQCFSPSQTWDPLMLSTNDGSTFPQRVKHDLKFLFGINALLFSDFGLLKTCNTEFWSIEGSRRLVFVLGTALWGLKTDHCSPMDHLHPMTVSLWVKMEDPQWPKLLQRWPLITHRWIIILFKMCEIPWNLIGSDGWIQYFAGYKSHRPSPFFKVKSASRYVFWCHGQPVRNASAARCQGLLHVQPLWRHQATAFQL